MSIEPVFLTNTYSVADGVVVAIVVPAGIALWRRTVVLSDEINKLLREVLGVIYSDTDSRNTNTEALQEVAKAVGNLARRCPVADEGSKDKTDVA